MRQIYITLTILAGIQLQATAQFWKTSEPIKLSGSVNSEMEESIPIFAQEGKELFFVRSLDEKSAGGLADQDVWFSSKVGENEYSNCKQVKELNNVYNNAIVGINKQGTKIYLLNAYAGRKDLKKGISTSELVNGIWSAPSMISLPALDIEGDFYGFCVNHDESAIIVSYTGQNSLGQEDLYAFIKQGSTWSQPIHLGNSINTTGFEISPFLSQNSDTLFFASNGLGGEGDADIFYAVKQGAWNSWSKPVNMGNKINTPKFDAYFVHNGKEAYWSSNRDAERSDIWTLHIVPPPAIKLVCSATDVTKFGMKNGTASAKTDGGVAPFTYLWSNGNKTESLSNQAPGKYLVTVTDAYGQIAKGTVNIVEPKEEVLIATISASAKQLFGYNATKLDLKKGEMKAFMQQVDDAIKNGEKELRLTINSSASTVPTKKFGTNEELAQKRANDMKVLLENYFAKSTAKVTVVINKTMVQGPTYESDAENKEKYSNYQYVEVVAN